MAPTRISRLVSESPCQTGIASVKAYSLRPLSLRGVEILVVTSISQYREDCTRHTRCEGHMCVTKDGQLLMPQWSLRGDGALSNVYNKEAEKLLEGHITADEYRTALRLELQTKRGFLRYKCLGGTVDGSLRSVIAPCWELSANEIALPRSVMANMRVPMYHSQDWITSLERSAHGKYTQVLEGMMALVVRPSVLWHGGCQPMVVRAWDHAAIGLSPHNCADFNADYDGDEVQVYPLTRAKSHNECLLWSTQTNDAVCIDGLENQLPEQDGRRTGWPDGAFVETTTLSIQSIMSGARCTDLMGRARMKAKCMSLCMLEPWCAQQSSASDGGGGPQLSLDDMHEDVEGFKSRCLQGVVDIMAQQLSQSWIGAKELHHGI